METPTARPSKPEASRWRWSLFQGILPYDKSRLTADILAGITLAAMNIPQAIGYTKIAGMPPVTGLYTLLLPLIAFAMFGASRYLVVAADSATAAILAVGVGRWREWGSPHYVALASMVALLVAVLLLLARLLRLGFLADFLSRTVFVGFLTGVGMQVGIAVSGEMLGIPVRATSQSNNFGSCLQHLPHVHWPTFAVSAGMVIVIFVTRRIGTPPAWTALRSRRRDWVKRGAGFCRTWHCSARTGGQRVAAAWFSRGSLERGADAAADRRRVFCHDRGAKFSYRTSLCFKASSVP